MYFILFYIWGDFMNRGFKEILKGYDYTLIITPIVLAAFGIIMIYSASMVLAVAEDFNANHYLIRQLLWFVIGLVGFFVMSLFPYKYFRNLSNLIALTSFILLLLVILIGDEAFHAIRSFRILGFNIQPSEFVKLGLIIFIAKSYSTEQLVKGSFLKKVMFPLAIAGILVTMVIFQPDLGTSFIIVFAIGTIVFASGIRFRQIIFLLTVSIMAIIAIIPFFVTDKRISRITGAYHPFLDPDDTGQHLIQSYLAISGGGLSGEGLGQSVQKLGYLWGAHNDFIMAVIVEELGVIGVFVVIGLLATIVIRGLYIATKCQDSFGSLIAIGISAMVGIQAFVNMGAISGILPITGVTLPFISYGGSSLLVLMLSMGILNNIARSVKIRETEPRIKEALPINDNRNRREKTW